MWGQSPSAVQSSAARRLLIPIYEIRFLRDFRLMTKTQPAPPHISTTDQTLVLSSLEHDQLVGVKKQHIPRRHFNGPELVVLWALRLYLLFMMAVVAYQVWTAAH
jgi:hypothetical protein